MNERKILLKVKKKEEVFGPNHADEVITVYEEPLSATSGKNQWQLWKLVETLSPEEIEVLILKRKHNLKHENNKSIIKNLKTEIMILEDAIKIIKRRVVK